MHVRPLGLFLALTLCALTPHNPALGDNWPRFRGPNGTGISTDNKVPVKWSARDGILWKTALPGTGHSSPIVWGERVFLQSANGKERLLLCLDTNKGKILWSKAVPGKVAHTHRFNTLASSTPATDGDRVYAVFWDGTSVGLYAYDFKGNLVWQQDLGRFTSQHGPGFSPIVHNGKVIVNNDQDGSAVVQAFEAKTGKKAWSATRTAFRACYSTPFLLSQALTTVTPDPKAQLIVTSTAGITAYDPANGKEIWKFTWSFPGMALRTVGSSVAADGMVFAASGDGSGLRSMIGVRAGGKGDITRGNPVWNREKDRDTPYVPTLLAWGGHLYATRDDGFALCYSAKTGKELWRARLGASVSASPILIDGKVYAVDEKGTVHVFEASPAGYKSLGRNPLGETVYSTPAVANGQLYIRGKNHLYCIGKATK
jgi:outer membrane protein assembly factor BamB